MRALESYNSHITIHMNKKIIISHDKTIKYQQITCVNNLAAS